MFGEFIGKVLLKTFIYKNPCIKNMDKQMIVSLGTGEFPAQMASYAENVSIWWRHHWNV